MCNLCMQQQQSSVNVAVYINSTWHYMCVFPPPCLSMRVCVLPYYATYRFNVSLTDWPDPAALLVFKPFKGDVFRIEVRRPERKYQHAQAAAAP